jgi:mRNA interferase RelE/StbE
LNVQFRSSFLKDVKVLTDKPLKERIKDAIAQVENARTLQDIGNLKKLRGGKNYYRIRIGHYRIGIIVEGQTVSFIRCLHRREIYRYLP